MNRNTPPRLVLSLNQNWRFRRDENDAWETVHLPHSVRIEPLNASGGRNYQGLCWYVRELEIKEQWGDRKLFVHFDGAMQVADVWLNDRKIATHFGGYTPFRIDITSIAQVGGENRLTVKLDNRDNPHVPPGKPQKALDFTYFGGLYRGVRLEVTDRLFITDPILADHPAGGGIFVTYPKVTSDAATVGIRTDLRNEHEDARTCTVRQELLAPGGETVATAVDASEISATADATFTQTLEVDHPQLWHPHHPHLYTLRTTIYDSIREADVQTTRIGIRHIRFDAHDGFFINGEKFCSMGVNRHQDHPYVGYALPDSEHWRDVKKLREGGFTSCRCHYLQSPAFMDACDELGMLTIVSNPGWQFCGDEPFRQRAVQNARTMVRRDRNRPSVILWEAALNETDNQKLMKPLRDAVHEEYPGDQCYTAGDQEPLRGWDVHYLHNDGTTPYWIREWGDVVDNWSDQQSSNRVARGWGEGPMLTQASSLIARMNDLLVGHHGSSSGPDGRRLCGACLWAGIDYSRGYHHQPFFGGVLDALRIPKFAYYFFQSQRPPGVHVPGLDDGPMVFIANFATPLSPTTITVFSNCQAVRLLHNGREIAVQAPDPGHRVAHPPFTFTLERFSDETSTMCMTGSAPGSAVSELRAEGLIGGEVAATHIVHPPGVPAKLVLHADLCDRSLMADGADWVRIRAHVCDARGTTCPFADDLIRFDVQGEGEIVESGQPGLNPVRAEAGIATVILRATPRVGSILVRASAFGLSDGELHVSSAASEPPRLELRLGERIPQHRQAEAPMAH